MISCIFKLLVLTNTLLLALPAGWCRAAHAAPADSAPAKQGGCPACPSACGPTRADSPPTPDWPIPSCCYQHNGVVWLGNEIPAPDPIASLCLAVLDNPCPRCSCDGRLAAAHPFPGPSLQVLHCVWLC